ncbi:hypothetical protein NMG60_11026898 [Bertholletia excelsa]
MGWLSHSVGRREIEAGDHIYTWRTAFAYAHHGIYVGGGKVVHFTPKYKCSSRNSLRSSSAGALGSSCSFSASTSENVSSLCSTFPDCGFERPGSGVIISCLDCFLGKGSLFRFEYGVALPLFLAKLRGGTCSTAKSDVPEVVIDRAMYLLHNGFGNYDIFRNNCEDFAIYCKTGLLILDETASGRSGQAASAIGAPLAALASNSLKYFMSSPVGVVAVTAAMYCASRYVSDVGVRDDVIKVAVENMALHHGWEGQNKVSVEENDSCKRRNELGGSDCPAKRPRSC